MYEGAATLQKRELTPAAGDAGRAVGASAAGGRFTSFIVRGGPIVCTPEDAFRCFKGSELDLLVVGNCVLDKTDQDEGLKVDCSSAFELD